MTHEVLPSVTARSSTAEAIYQALREAITNGALAPAARLREQHLSRHFGVSTTPVREALLRLSRDGLVEIYQNRGAVVASLDRQGIADLYEIREVLEERAVRRAALAPTQDFSTIDQLLAEMAPSLNDADQITFNRLDVDLHRQINLLSGNVALADLAEQIQRRIQVVRARCAIQLAGRPAVSHAQHLALLQAIRECEPDQAAALLREHIRSVRDAVLHVFTETAPDDAAASR